MKLKVGDSKTFFQWRSQAIKEEYLVKWLDVQKLSTLPLRWKLKEIEVASTSSVQDVILRLTGKEPTTINNFSNLQVYTMSGHKIPIKGTSTTERYLYCLTASNGKLNPNSLLTDYDIQEGDLLLLGEETLSNKLFDNTTLKLVITVKDFTDFRQAVVEAEDIQESVDRRYTRLNGSYEMKGVLLYTDEDAELARYIRYNFCALSAMTGQNFLIYTIEQPTQIRGISAREYWKAVLEQNTYSFLHLLGWTQSKPYDKAQAYKIAYKLGVYPDTLPCIILFESLDRDEKIVVKITGEFQTFFRRLSAIVLRTMEILRESGIQVVESYVHDESIFGEFKKAFLEAWSLEHREDGEKQNRSITFNFNDKTVFINRPNNTEIRDFQNRHMGGQSYEDWHREIEREEQEAKRKEQQEQQEQTKKQQEQAKNGAAAGLARRQKEEANRAQHLSSSSAPLTRADVERLRLAGGHSERIDLSGRDLHEIDLHELVLNGVNLRGADLRGANLHWTKLKGADLSGADLSGADLFAARLEKANLFGANLCRAKLQAYMNDADLSGADLSGADLYDAYMSGANLQGATMPDGSIHL